MSKLFSIFILLMSTLQLEAQTKSLLKSLEENTSIIWIAEVETNYTFQKESNYWTESDSKYANLNNRNYLNLLKYSVEKDNKGFPSKKSAWENIENYFATELIQIATNNATPLYYTSKCAKQLTKEEALSTVQLIDTLISGGNTFETNYGTSYIVNDLPPSQIIAFRVHQYIVYNKEEARFKSYPTSLAPLKVKLDEFGEIHGTTPMFWIPINLLNKTHLQNNKNISWAIGVQRDIPLENISVIKNEKKAEEVIELLIEKIIKNNLEVAKINSDDNYSEIMPLQEIVIKNIIDYETFEEVEQIDTILFKDRFNTKNIKMIRLYQEFAWDYINQKLFVKHLGFFPIENRYDDNGNFLNCSPIFFRHEDMK